MRRILIVGQGLAGTLLCHELETREIEFIVIDKGHDKAASHVAAGLVNPITGRKYVKSWMFEELLRQARKTYTALESRINSQLLTDRIIVRVLPDIKSENNWCARMEEDGYSSYISLGEDESWPSKHLKPVNAIGITHQSLMVNIKKLIASYRTRLVSMGRLIEKPLNFGNLLIDHEVEYEGEKYSDVVFCEGSGVTDNPYFNYLPFLPVKGEVLIVKIPGTMIEDILKDRLFIAPLGDEIYWIGSRYIKEFDDNQPTSDERAYIEGVLDELLTVDYNVISHESAIRPSTVTRKPILGSHPDHDNVWLFNGLGTKGVSLGPYMAGKFINHMINRTDLIKEVNIRQYDHLLS